MKKLGASFLLLASLTAAASSDSPLAQPKKAEAVPKNRKPPFSISKETTSITEPLDADGYPDYAAALHQRLQRGVTPDNNAAVLLWKAFGPHPEGAKMPEPFFKWLGVKPPEKGDYFTPLRNYLKNQNKGEGLAGNDPIFEDLARCSHRPWKASQHPQFAAWLKSNEKPLALVVEATKRSHYYSPLVPKISEKGSSGLIGALMPGVQKCRELASALTARAMLRLGEGRLNDAWDDLLACHRLGRLVARGSTLIEALVGIAIDAVAAKADLAFLDNANVKTERLQSCLRDLQKLPPLPRMADKVDLGERFFGLDALTRIVRYGPDALRDFGNGPQLLIFPENWCSCSAFRFIHWQT
jgi:hypothetical protein